MRRTIDLDWSTYDRERASATAHATASRDAKLGLHHIPLSQAAKYHGQDGIRGDLGGGKGVVMGKYDHDKGTITDVHGVEHKVISVDPTAHEAGFKGDIASSHLPQQAKNAMAAYERALAEGRPTEAQPLRLDPTVPSGSAPSTWSQYAKARRSGSTSMSNQYRRAIEMAAPKLGSGGRFKALSATLAARGAHNPDALAAWIGRKKYGAKGMAALSHHSHANAGLLDILLAEGGPSGGYEDSMKCPNCGFSGGSASFKSDGSSGGTSMDKQPGELRTPATGDTGTAGMNGTQGVNVAATGSSVRGALSNTGHRSIGLAATLSPALRIDGPYDFIVNRDADDPAVVNVRHRRGGDLIGQIQHSDQGWQGVVGGQNLTAHTQQRAALLELLGAHNRRVVGNGRPSEPLPYQMGTVQTPLMQQFGIPAIRAFATPANGAGQGPRVTAMASGDGPDDSAADNADSSAPSGLSPKGQAIYKKLIAKGFPAARAMAFAKRAQNMQAGSFKKAS